MDGEGDKNFWAGDKNEFGGDKKVSPAICDENGEGVLPRPKKPYHNDKMTKMTKIWHRLLYRNTYI
jgi:hypothetical protein